MQKRPLRTYTSKSLRFPLPIELRFRIVRATWTAEDHSDGERTLFPSVVQRDKGALAKEVKNPDELRRRFFRLELNEESALDFLNEVGVWYAVANLTDRPDSENPRSQNMRFRSSFGHDYFKGNAGVMTLESLIDEQRYWKDMLNGKKLRAEFLQVPTQRGQTEGDTWFALLGTLYRTLKIHLEARGDRPQAVIQAASGRELLTALAWFDLVMDAEFRVCNKCTETYSYARSVRGGWNRGGSKFCSIKCEHANTVQTWRKKNAAARRIVEQNSDATAPNLLKLLAAEGLEKSPDWITKERAALKRNRPSRAVSKITRAPKGRASE